jgi:glycosyltransferase involved in cell wall biosynthesis
MMQHLKNSKSTGSKATEPRLPFIYAALPVLNEPEFLPRLLECISLQSYRSFKLVVCVNQPDSWWNDALKLPICKNNARSLKLLKNWKKFPVEVIDRTSKGSGWLGKKHGVGWARKTAMDLIASEAKLEDIIISLDADSTFTENYFLSIANAFSRNTEAVAMAVPYFHRAPADPDAYRAILRYEIYMRYYLLNLLRIGSPYAFSALGSAIACPVWAYKAIGGLSPKLSGEDFYFLQKLRKFGPVILWNDEYVCPEARFSDRVFFGTGPAMIKGNSGDWSSYPVYSYRSFNEILETTLLFPLFFFKTLKTRVTQFMATIFAEKDPWKPIRENHADIEHFQRGCHEKLDGLRILQYLKAENALHPGSDEERLFEWLLRFCGQAELRKLKINLQKFSFETAQTEQLESIRTFLFVKEMEARFNSELE